MTDSIAIIGVIAFIAYIIIGSIVSLILMGNMPEERFTDAEGDSTMALVMLCATIWPFVILVFLVGEICDAITKMRKK